MEVALLIETSAIIATSNVKIVIFYRGCLDDRAALKLALKFSLSPGVHVTLVHITPARSGQVSIDLSAASVSVLQPLSHESEDTKKTKDSARTSFITPRDRPVAVEKEKRDVCFFFIH